MKHGPLLRLFLCLTIAATITLTPAPTQAQVTIFEWARCFQGTLITYGADAKADALGNVYAVGQFSDISDFDPGPGVANLSATGTNYDLYIAKLDPAGNYLWAIDLGEMGIDLAWAIDIDTMNNLYVTGTFEDTTDFDPGPGIAQLFPVGERDIFIAKFTGAGNLVWVRQMAGPGEEQALDLVLDHDANIYLAGEFRDSVDFDPGPGIFQLGSLNTHDAFIAKLDPNGNFLWARRVGESLVPDGAKSIATDPVTGAVAATGFFTGTVDFDPGPGTYNLTTNGSYEIFVLKLDSAGNFMWAGQVGANIYDVGHDIAMDGLGRVTITGYFMDTVDFDPGPGQAWVTGGNMQNAFILQLDAAGNFLWARHYGTPTDHAKGLSVTHDAAHNIYAAGSFQGTIDFDPDTSVISLTSTFYDSYVCKLDPAGNLVWVKHLTGPNTKTASSLSMDASGNLYTMGQFKGLVDFDPGPGVYNLNGGQHFDAFLLKWRECGPAHLTLDITACDTFISPSGNHTWTTSGTYFDTLSTIAGCDTFLFIKLDIVPTPATDFSFTANYLTTTFTDLTTSATAWTWDFGDGNTSTQQHPTHTYAAPGTYTVCLTAIDQGCTDSICHTVTVIALGKEEERHKLSAVPNPSTGIFQIESTQDLDARITDVHGKPIAQIHLTAGRNRIDLTYLAQGIYFLHVSDGSFTKYLPLVKLLD